MTVRLALLGCGWVADMHARAAAACGLAVAGVANHRLESAERFAAEHGIERVTTDWRTLVASPDVDAVVVCTPNALHSEQSIAALAAGKHVLCEKPMATTAADGEAMLAAAAEHDRLLLILHPWRHHPAVIAVRDAIAAGELGRVVRTHGYGVHADWGPGGWFTDPALAGGGALVDMGIHAIDTARFLLGEPDRPTRLGVDRHGVRGVRGRRRRHRADRLGERGALRRRVRLVAAAPRRLRGGHGGLRQLGLPAHLVARAAARLRALRAQPVRRADARLPLAYRRLATRRAVAPARPRRPAHLRAGVRGRARAIAAMPADRPLRVAGIAGSLRRASFNRGLLRAAIEIAPVGMTIDPLEIRELPLYDADLDVDGGPEVVRAFKAAILAADGVFIATPEYNYSLPGVLKNALDWASRAPERALQDKPVAIVGATPGHWGTVRSQLALRQVLMFPACRVMPGPMLTIADAREYFDEAGNLTEAAIRARLVDLLDAFAAWIQQVG